MKKILKPSLTVALTAVTAIGFAVSSAPLPARAISSCPADPLSALTPYTADYSTDANAINAGVKFKVNGAPYVQGVSFYKGSGNTGVHVAHLYDMTTSTDLASETYTSETTSGWQSVDFSSVVQVNDAHNYMVWVSMPNGNYAVDGAPGGSNSFDEHGQFGASDDVVYLPGGSSTGVYAYSSDDTAVPNSTTGNNLWVSPIVADATAPNNNSGLSASDATAGPTLTWSGMGYDTNSATSTGTPVRTVISRTANEEGSSVIAAQAGGQTGLVGTNDPTALPGRQYFYTVKNQDACGHLSTGATTTVNTAARSLTRLFSSNPSTLDTGQTDPVTVGMRWSTASAGNVWGARFYRGSNTAPTSGQFQVGLWDNDGTLLASRSVLAGNQQGGWIDVRFSSPVSVSANHDYVLGYYSPNGKEMYTNDTFDSAVNPMNGLTAPADSSGTPNGVYSTSSSFSYPGTQSGNSTWYGVDVDFYVP